MKLIIVILDDQDADAVVTTLIERDFRVTRVASTGGFLRRGNTTLLIGLEEDKVDAALELIREARLKTKDLDRNRATIFVLDTAHFAQL